MIDHPELEAEVLRLLREQIECMRGQALVRRAQMLVDEFDQAAARLRERRRRRRRQTYRLGPPNGNVTPAVERGYLSMLARRSNLRSLRNMTHWRRGTGAWEGIR